MHLYIRSKINVEAEMQKEMTIQMQKMVTYRKL